MKPEQKQEFKDRVTVLKLANAQNEKKADGEVQLISHKKKDFVFPLGSIKKMLK